MDIAVVYESLFGNTRAIAEAIAGGARQADPGARVTVLGAAETTPGQIGEAELVIAGGPTHIRGMSKPSTRRQAPPSTGNPAANEQRGAATGPGIREWLAALPAAPPGRMAAAFDTRLAFPLAGGAARPIARGLRRRGYRVITRPMGFLVDGGQGPLQAGERDRAGAWGADLVRQLARQPAR